MSSGSLGMNLPPLTTYPVDGYGGSYYDVQFPVPVYNSQADGVFDTVSWSDIDTYYNLNASDAVEYAVCFGICTVTLLNVVVLTPQSKRRLPLYNFICIALSFQVIRNAVDMVLMTTSLQVSSYWFLTLDLEAIQLSSTYYTLILIEQVSACISFVFVQACFYIQGRALMTWLRLHHRKIYFSILAYLVLGGVVTVGLRVAFAVYQIIHPLNPDIHAAFRVLNHATLIAYGISIGSWSLVSFVSTISVIFNRRRTILRGNNVYDVALNLVAIVGIESFIVPILLCVLQLLPIRWKLSNPEQLIVPSVLFLLPIGSLFLTVHDKGGAKHDRHPPSSVLGDPTHQLNRSPVNNPIHPLSQSDTPFQTGARSEQEARATLGSMVLTTTANKARKVTSLFEVELAMMDAFDEEDTTDSLEQSTVLRDEDAGVPSTQQTISTYSGMRGSSQLLPNRSISRSVAI